MCRILIVEDDLDISRLIQKILEKTGYKTICAFSGTEAELRLMTEAFDFV